MFCSSYNQDKSISTFLGRPIRISKRHTDIKLPLDLADSEVTGDQARLNSAIAALDTDGWNTKGRWLRASWIVSLPMTWSNPDTNEPQRLRHISLRFREEILEFSLVKIDANAEAQLLYVSHSDYIRAVTNQSVETYPSVYALPGKCYQSICAIGRRAGKKTYPQ